MLRLTHKAAALAKVLPTFAPDPVTMIFFWRPPLKNAIVTCPSVRGGVSDLFISVFLDLPIGIEKVRAKVLSIGKMSSVQTPCWGC